MPPQELPKELFKTPTYFPLESRPGVKRDGTDLEGDFYTDAIWTRFNRRGKPKKMGGYRIITSGLPGLCRGIIVNPRSSYNDVHLGHAAGVSYISISSDGSPASGISDRTPAGYVTNNDVIWQFDQIYDSFGAGSPRVLAMPTEIGAAIDSQTNVKMYYGDVTASGVALVDSTAPQCSGGVAVFHPYTFVYGNDGRVNWSDPSLPGTWNAANTVRIAASKVVKGLPMRGGSDNAPAGLFWTLDSLIRCTLNPSGTPTFRFDTVGQDISVMSSNCVIEMDGVFYWLGEERFFMYNGVVQELKNPISLETIMSRRTYAARMRSWAYAHPAENELHFCVPVDGSMEPNWDFIYNVGLGTWYDTPLPDSGRGAGHPAHVFPFPLMTGVDASAGTYILWQHEHPSMNRLEGANSYAILAAYETANIAYMTSGPLNGGWMGRNRNIRLIRIEPDWVQVGDLRMSVNSRGYARSTPITTTETFSPTTKKMDSLRLQGRQITFRVESNVVDGNFEHGAPLILIEEGDERPLD